MKKLKTTGFTLVEIAIVMVIIGLLLGGALKGQQMIENARYKAFRSQINELRAAIYSFQDIYGYFPGDIPTNKLKILLPDAKRPNNGSNGNVLGDGKVNGGYCTEGSQEESCFVFNHLRQAGLINGDPSLTHDAAKFDISAGGYYESISTGPWVNGKNQLKLLTREVPGTIAQRLDSEIDDGAGTTGDVNCWNGCDWESDQKQSIFITL